MYWRLDTELYPSSNITTGGSDDQIRYIVERGCIPPLCEFLNSNDTKIVEVALDAIDKILYVRLFP